LHILFILLFDEGNLVYLKGFKCSLLFLKKRRWKKSQVVISIKIQHGPFSLNFVAVGHEKCFFPQSEA